MTQADEPLLGLGLTALLVAGARAEEGQRADRLFDDAFACWFIEAARAASSALAETLEQRAVADEAKRARHDSVAIRTRFCDEYLLDAAAKGCRQIVLLAAGLDARAFRLAWPEGTRLWELDTPEVFAFKERVLAAHGATPACERLVIPADLREAWAAALCGAGFEPELPTAWLAEGLLMYLDEGERDLLLERITEVSSAGSRLALDHRPGFFSTPVIAHGGEDTASEARFAALAAAAASDPSLTTPEARFAQHGWQAQVEDPARLFARYGRAAPAGLTAAADGEPRAYLATAVRP